METEGTRTQALARQREDITPPRVCSETHSRPWVQVQRLLPRRGRSHRNPPAPGTRWAALGRADPPSLSYKVSEKTEGESWSQDKDATLGTLLETVPFQDLRTDLWLAPLPASGVHSHGGVPARRGSGGWGRSHFPTVPTNWPEDREYFPEKLLYLYDLGSPPPVPAEETSSRGSSRTFSALQRAASDTPEGDQWTQRGRQWGRGERLPWRGSPVSHSHPRPRDSHLNPLLAGAAPTPPSGCRGACRPSQCRSRSRPRPVAMETRRESRGKLRRTTPRPPDAGALPDTRAQRRGGLRRHPFHPLRERF